MATQTAQTAHAPVTHRSICHSPAVVEALSSPVLVPPPAPDSLGSGPIAKLRADMARFTYGPEHANRRADLARAIARIDTTELLKSAKERTLLRLNRGLGLNRDLGLNRGLGLNRDEDNLCVLGYVVPTEAMAIQVVNAPASLQATVAETEQIARAIGRGEPVTADMDAACDRLLARVADHPDGPVAAASLLYQGFDSTAALFRETVQAAGSSEPRRSAVDATARVTTAETTIDGHRFGAGEMMELSLRGQGLEFGAGPHRCPGEDLAFTIVAGMTLALDEKAAQPNGDE